MVSAVPPNKIPAGREAEEARLAVHFREPVTHLYLDGREPGQVVHVTVPVRIAKRLGADDMTTIGQFLDAIDSDVVGYARFIMHLIDDRADDANVTWSSREELEVALTTPVDVLPGPAAPPADVVVSKRHPRDRRTRRRREPGPGADQ
jgi:hypothetical protein